MTQLSAPVTVLPRVGKTRAEQLKNLGIETLSDLISAFPRTYDDRTRLLPVAELTPEEPACFRATVTSNPVTSRIPKPGKRALELTKLTVADHSARLRLVFFNQRYAAETLHYGDTYYFYGTVSGDYLGYCMTNPVFEREEEPPRLTRRILPVYPLTAGISNSLFSGLVGQALAVCLPEVREVLPAALRERYALCDVHSAYREVHQPQSFESLEAARRRLVFDEFYCFSAALALSRAARETVRRAPFSQLELSDFFAALPFALTGAQRRVISEITADLGRDTPMCRMVQGDVGSGKTVVAAAAAVCAVKNGFQAAFMAPTELLAEQHYKTLCTMLAPLSVRVGLLTGSMTPGEKRAVRLKLAAGEIDLILGTHALLSDTTAFCRLGLVIADEQHRFGVNQRNALLKKGEHPHLLVMSATPIPRSLALILYGDLDLSVLDELPPGRQRVDTFLVNESMRARINAFIRKQVEAGGQCYIVCPAIEESESGDAVKSAELWAKTLQETVFRELRVALLHGRMKGAEKDAIMQAFAAGAYDILVATTVIEVGVDVPNATLMVIENADRFGLSQLHQLRGRVGRGQKKSYCVLFSSNQNSQTLQRLKALCRTNNGFRIAEADLELRGPGEFFGERQHGLPMFRLGSLSLDLTTLHQAQEAADAFLQAEDYAQTPEYAALAERIAALFAKHDAQMN